MYFLDGVPMHPTHVVYDYTTIGVHIFACPVQKPLFWSLCSLFSELISYYQLIASADSAPSSVSDNTNRIFMHCCKII